MVFELQIHNWHRLCLFLYESYEISSLFSENILTKRSRLHLFHAYAPFYCDSIEKLFVNFEENREYNYKLQDYRLISRSIESNLLALECHEPWYFRESRFSSLQVVSEFIFDIFDEIRMFQKWRLLIVIRENLHKSLSMK
jgi:hypothetical protein